MKIVTADPERSPFYPTVSFSKPGAYITHNATEPLSDITRGHLSGDTHSGATEGFTLLPSQKQWYSLRPVNTLLCGKLVELPLKKTQCTQLRSPHGQFRGRRPHSACIVAI